MFVSVSKEEAMNDVQTGCGWNIKELHDFLESGMPCAQYVLQDGENARSKAAGFNTAARRCHLPVVVSRHKDRIYFFREENK